MKIIIKNSRCEKKYVEVNPYMTVGEAKEKANEIGNRWMINS